VKLVITIECISYVAGDVLKRLQGRIYKREKKTEKVGHDEFNHFKLSPNIIWAQESKMIRWACGTHGEEVDERFWLGRLKKKAMRRHSYRLEAI